MKKDRFGNPRCDGYNKEDFELCRCVTEKSNADKIVRGPRSTCPSCGGYGEIPKGTK